MLALEKFLIRKWTNFLLQKVKEISLNLQIEACNDQTQLQQIFYASRTKMNAVNLTTMLKKITEQKRFKDQKSQQSSFVKSVIDQIQARWSYFISVQADYRPLINLILYLGNNKLYYLNKKIIEVNLMHVFHQVNNLQKLLMLNGILALNIQSQFNAKYQNLKESIIGKIFYVQARFAKAEELIKQNIINILIYRSSFIQAQILITIWKQIVQKQLDTKFFNNHMILLIKRYTYFWKKGDNAFRDYVYLLKIVSQIKKDIQNITIRQVIKNYPRNSKGLRHFQISMFYNLVSVLPQLKQFVQQQLKELRSNSVKDWQKSAIDDFSSQQTSNSLLKIVQRKFIKQMQQGHINLKGIAIVLFQIPNLDQFYPPPVQVLKQIQLALIKIIKTSKEMLDHKDLLSILACMTRFYLSSRIQSAQIADFYRQVVQFLIKQDFDQMITDYLCQILYFIAGYRRKQVFQSAKNKTVNPKKAQSFSIFGFRQQFKQKMLSTLKKPNRIITLSNLQIIIINFQKLQIADKEVCDFIKRQIQAFQASILDQKESAILKKNIKRQMQFSCWIMGKNCQCKLQQKKLVSLKMFKIESPNNLTQQNLEVKSDTTQQKSEEQQNIEEQKPSEQKKKNNKARQQKPVTFQKQKIQQKASKQVRTLFKKPQ